MKKETVGAICTLWNILEDEDISTGSLLEMIREQLNLSDISDVITGLKKGGMLKERTDD